MNYLAAVLVLILPGLALLAWLDGRKRDVFLGLADSIALSVSLTTLFGLACFLLGFSPGVWGGLVFYALALLALTAALLRQNWALAGAKNLLRRAWRPALAALFGLALLAGAVAWRFYQARPLAFPAWVDSVQHTLVTIQIIETGGLPDTMDPYLPGAPFYYHYGFHILAAAFAQWTGMAPDQAVLWLGQFIHALLGLGMYSLGRSLGLKKGGSLLAALLATFVMQMPAYYLTWGRFTLLTGLAVLFPAMSAALDVRRKPDDGAALLRLGVLIAGLCLTHYLAVVMMVLFLGILGVEALVRDLRGRRPFLSFSLLRLAGPSLLGALAALPWMLRVLQNQPASLDVVLPGEGAADWTYLTYLLGPRYNHILMGMAAGAFALSLLMLGLELAHKRPDNHTAVRAGFALWTLLLLLLALPFGLRLGPFRPDHYVIILFIPASIWLGGLLAESAAAIREVWNRWAGWGAMLLVMALLVGLGLRETRSVLNPVTLLADKMDRAALDWVNQNVPDTARFYINATHWQGGVYRGLDGGAWIVPYTGRQALVPPISYMWLPEEEYTKINGWAQQTTRLKGCTPDFWQLVREAGLTHVYLRQGRGTLQPEMLTDCPRLRVVYREGGVWIYEILLP